ncbi:MAG: hypothetical protein CTY34_01810 [Methylobacter sp.]|nr:MAG: hypothetical protein CTY34_01810 [Methylobacter sp.]PPD18906.1 MAG: hypothetical protein CTY24_12175 [Methylobacter sp.]PPD37176.1 MAG: hypothetical protein CTY18_02395 [Methylomonas sp.]
MKLNPEFYYWASLTGFFGLFALLMLWPTVLAPPQGLPVALILLITISPLLLVLRGLLSKHRKACAWAAYVSLLYFIHGSSATYADAGAKLYPALETVFSLLLFTGSMLYVRSLKTTA